MNRSQALIPRFHPTPASLLKILQEPFDKLAREIHHRKLIDLFAGSAS
jgi:hypothetical protein